jgi:diguanylate cyclase (GGDEF)-like protein
MGISSIFSRGVARAKPFMSIRARLVVIALLAVVPLMLDRVRILEASRTERIEVAATEALDLARRGAQAQREIVTTVRSMLQVMARAYVTMLARGETCNLYITDLASGMAWIRGMSIIGPDGRIKCSNQPAVIGLDLSDRSYYRETLESREFVLSNYLISRTMRQPTIVAAYPTQAIDPTTNAVVVASINLQSIRALVGSLERRPGALVLLVDGTGTVIAGEPQGTEWMGKNLSDAPLLQDILDRGEGTVRTDGLDGIRRIYGFVRMPSTDARLVIGLDESEVLRQIDQDIKVAYAQLALFGMLVLLIAWFGGVRLIVRPIRSLSRMAARFGRGDLDVRPAKVSWAKEFEPLADALDDMAQKLADREKELLAANRHLEQLASLDALSGLANRRGFDARLTADWQRAGKLRRPVALLMVDVDHFKLFNDRYGHLEGDVCLRRLGKLLMDAARGEDDLPARYGGEEFALLIPGADLAKGLAVAERLRKAVEDLCIAHASSPNGQVTISIGVASLVPAIGEDAECLVEAADAGLYSAKRRGRNAVVAHAPVTLAAAS